MTHLSGPHSGPGGSHMTPNSYYDMSLLKTVSIPCHCRRPFSSVIIYYLLISYLVVCFSTVSFRAQIKLEPRPDWPPLAFCSLRQVFEEEGKEDFGREAPRYRTQILFHFPFERFPG